MDWRVFVLAAISFLGILVGLVVMALPDPYEGSILYTMNASHSISRMDLLGLALAALGGVVAWWAGILWQKKVGRGQDPARRGR